MQEIIASCRILADQKEYHSIVDICGHQITISDEGRKFYKDYSEKASLKRSQSVVINTLGKSLIVGAVMKIINYITPHKSFGSRDAALAWIMSIDPEVKGSLKKSA